MIGIIATVKGGEKEILSMEVYRGVRVDTGASASNARRWLMIQGWEIVQIETHNMTFFSSTYI